MSESAKRLARYLDYEAVCSGKAVEAATEDYRDVTRQREIGTNLPIAFAKLVEEQDETLIELLTDKVESLCGCKPEPDIVAKYLAEGPLTNVRAVRVRKTTETSSLVTPAGPPADAASPCGFVLAGKHYAAKNPTEVYIKVFEELSKRGATFLPRFAALPKHGKKRRYIA